jgi:coproporphyrinogen III oxidase
MSSEFETSDPFSPKYPSSCYTDLSIPLRDRVTAYLQHLQKSIFDSLTELDPSAEIRRDHWQRPSNGGYGLSCVVQDGEVFEKGGVNISVLDSFLSPAMVQNMRADHAKNLDWYDPADKRMAKLPYFVCGISSVIHLRNPMGPTVHFNYRYFEVSNPLEPDSDKPKAWWFGGGSDLTPTYLFEEDAIHFHKTLKSACDKTDPKFFPEYKKWCDNYFYIPHRNEARGVGGIFFDDLSDRDPEILFKFIRDCGDSFKESYFPSMERRNDMSFTEDNKKWQQIRRGRYVEFNLVHDRGTKCE